MKVGVKKTGQCLQNKPKTDAAEATPVVAAPKQYNTTMSLPHPVPLTAFYQEKIPLLYVLKQSLLSYVAAGQRSSDGRRQPEQRFMAVECGVYRGHSLIAAACMVRDLGVPAQFFGLDTFAGLPQLSQTDLALSPERAPYVDRILFGDAPLSEVQARCAAAGVADSITLVEGLFEASLKTLPDVQYDFVSIDCDLYEGHIQCLEHFYPRMKKGGAIFFDDYYSETFPMARRAVDDFMAGRPEALFHLRFGDEGVNQTKAFLLKGDSL